MVFIIVLLTIFVALSHTLALNENTSSNCFDQTGFEQQNYGDLSSKAWLNFGVVALIDYRYTAQLTQTRMQQTVDELNTYFAASKIRLVNLQLYLLDQQYAPDLTMETADGSDWETPEIKQNWRTAATPVLGQGNVVFVFHSIKAAPGSSYTVGELQGPFPQDQTDTAESFLWMNVDGLNTGQEPLFDSETMIHELCHKFGLYHTFDYQFGCDVNDDISDTGPANYSFGKCGDGGYTDCGETYYPRLDFSNIMSYGQCRTGTRMTRGQQRRIRCTVEQDIPSLTALPDSALASQPIAPPAVPNNVNFGNLGNTVQGIANGLGSLGSLFGGLFGNIFGNGGNNNNNNNNAGPTPPAAPTPAAQAPAPYPAPAPYSGGNNNNNGGWNGFWNGWNRRRRDVEDDEPTATPTSTPTSTPAPLKQYCNGIAGVCVNATDSCALPTLAHRCSGALVCCPNPKLPTPAKLPGVGKSCLGIPGVCIDVDVTKCDSSNSVLIKGRCVGDQELVQCCAKKEAVPPSNKMPPLGVNFDAQVDIDHTIAFPVGYTVHVGSKLWLPIPIVLRNVLLYIVHSSIVFRPTTQQLDGRLINAQYTDSGALLELSKLANNEIIDRGDYVIVATGNDASNADQMFVSTVITIDVNSCALKESAKYKTAYGLVRTPLACQFRNGTQVESSTMQSSNETVCCLEPMVSTGFHGRARRVGSKGSSISSTTLSVQYRGMTQFWGAPMTVKLTKSAATTNPLILMSATEPTMQLPPPIVVLNNTGDEGTFTPRVSNPGIFMLTDSSGLFASTRFSIVSLPCKLNSGIAGYCLPTKRLTANGVVTKSDQTCSDGEADQCSHLAMGDIPFACCYKAASAIQKQASYLQSLQDFEQTNGASMQSQGVSIGFIVGMVFIALALVAIIVALVWFFVIRRMHARDDIEINNAAYYSARQ